jgi:hypothetical protein
LSGPTFFADSRKFFSGAGRVFPKLAGLCPVAQTAMGQGEFDPEEGLEGKGGEE